MKAITHVVRGVDDEPARPGNRRGSFRQFRAILLTGPGPLRPELGSGLPPRRVIQEYLSGGGDGYRDDWAAVLTPWGCDLPTIGVPVRLWHGVRDQAVPIVHGRWLAANVPGMVAHLAESEDHGNVEQNNKKTAYAWLGGLA